MKQVKLYIQGMTCVNCRDKIEKALQKMPEVQSVSVNYEKGTADISYREKEMTPEKMIAMIEQLGYQASLERPSRQRAIWNTLRELLVILVLFLALQYFGILHALAPGSLAETGMGYGMLFVIGVITSVHCVAMCGGINLSQTLHGGDQDISRAMFRNTLAYNLGRVVSYTVIGGILGGLGGLTGISQNLQTASFFQGILKLLAGIVMVVMGVNLLGLFPMMRKLHFRLPFSGKHAGTKGKTPFVVGLCNGFMPCGPLQSVQILALASGSAFTGAMSMLCFSLGTVPLMLGFGTVVSTLGKRFTGQVLRVGGILVVVMGLSMMAQGNALAGFVPLDGTGIFRTFQTQTENVAVEKDGVQVVSSTLQPGKYPDITVKAGEPVEWIIQADAKSINGCNYKAVLQDFGLEQVFEEGENVIAFTPTEAGVYTYSCWMGMITGKIYVEE